MKKISLIIPAYNAEKYIDRCLDSVVNQTMQEIEIIIVNDGSTDATGQKINRWAYQDSRIIVLHQSNNGISSSRNTGLSKATGEYIAWLDADDWAEIDMLETMYNAAKHNVADIVVSDWYKNYPNGRQKALNDVEFCEITGETFCQLLLTGRARAYPWNKLYSSSLYKKNQIWYDCDLPIGEDFVANVQLASFATKVTRVKKPLVHYFQTEHSASRGSYSFTRESNRNKMFAGVNSITEFFVERQMYSIYHPYLSAYNVVNMINHLKDKAFCYYDPEGHRKVYEEFCSNYSLFKEYKKYLKIQRNHCRQIDLLRLNYEIGALYIRLSYLLMDLRKKIRNNITI